LSITKSKQPHFIEDWETRVGLSKGETISTDTYFNCFFESFYLNHTNLKKIILNVEFIGEVFIELIRVSKGKRHVILKQKKVSADEPTVVSFTAPTEREIGSRIFFNITGLSKSSSLLGASWYSASPPLQEVRLAIVMCTFKREEWVKKNVSKIIDSELCTLPVELIVIDNASELTLPKHPKVTVIQQANLGGAGGFGRGILEAFEGSRDFSHVLLMDDDIDIELSSIHRLYNLLRYTNPDHMSCFGGAMLDRFLPEMLYECGADQVKDKGKINHIKPTLSNLDLNTFESLDKIAVKKPSDYGAWWFFCFSRQAFKNVGMPMPCFIRGDDKEYGLRLKKNGYATDFPPGIGVWHEPFYAKHDGWLKYFDLYNALVTAALGRFANSSLQNVMASTEQGVLGSIQITDYIAAEMQILAAEDFLKGVNHFYDVQSRLAAARTASSKFILNIDIHNVNEYFKNNRNYGLYEKAKIKFKKLKRFKVTHDHSQIANLMKEYYIIYLTNPFNNNVQVFRRDAGVERIQRKRLKDVLKGISLSWGGLMRDFLEAEKEFTTVEFWREYTQGLTTTGISQKNKGTKIAAK
jgi:galactofuranosylgalactofuranosylrhamnosyl-N-acetylglucosaminyl-diphospho-decaprenol beta-1,5/1,6-galactofuranosyltransferase